MCLILVQQGEGPRSFDVVDLELSIYQSWIGESTWVTKEDQ
jgi:hypothetical protein